jgi:hypothetical protein
MIQSSAVDLIIATSDSKNMKQLQTMNAPGGFKLVDYFIAPYPLQPTLEA